MDNSWFGWEETVPCVVGCSADSPVSSPLNPTSNSLLQSWQQKMSSNMAIFPLEAKTTLVITIWLGLGSIWVRVRIFTIFITNYWNYKFITTWYHLYGALQVALMVKNLPANAENLRDMGWIPGWVGKIPGEGNGNPLQYSCLENPMDRGTWQATVHGVARVRLSD